MPLNVFDKSIVLGKTKKTSLTCIHLHISQIINNNHVITCIWIEFGQIRVPGNRRVFLSFAQRRCSFLCYRVDEVTVGFESVSVYKQILNSSNNNWNPIHFSLLTDFHNVKPVTHIEHCSDNFKLHMQNSRELIAVEKSTTCI